VKKIASLFQRNEDGLIRDEITPGCEWVAAGEGVATQKFDGTAVLVRRGELFKRFDARNYLTIEGQPPDGFVPAQEQDPVTGHWPGWLPVGAGAEDKWFREAWALRSRLGPIADGTYELCGPRINGNPEGLSDHLLLPHGDVVLSDVPRDFAGLKSYLTRNHDIEGIVFWHPDGRRVKVKGKDFGLKRS
jgi:hypothetical protein